MSPLDNNIVNQKIEIVLKEIGHLKSYDISSISDNTDFKTLYSLIYSIQKALSAIIDVAQHILVKEFDYIPDSYADGIFQLGQKNILPKDFAKTFSEAAKFRNKIVHNYDDIDLEKVKILVPDLIEDAQVFCDCILKNTK